MTRLIDLARAVKSASEKMANDCGPDWESALREIMEAKRKFAKAATPARIEELCSAMKALVDDYQRLLGDGVTKETMPPVLARALKALEGE